MALRPCSAHRGRFNGPAESVYPAVVVGVDSERSKLKMCPRCFAAYSDTVLSKLTEVSDEDYGLNFEDVCFWGREPESEVNRLFPVFVTWYPRGLPRHDAYAQICAVCLRDHGSELLEPRYAAPGGASNGK